MAGLVIFSTLDLIFVIDHRSDVKKAILANHIGEGLFSAARDWAYERGTIHIALNAADPVEDKARAATGTRRLAADNALAEAIRKLDGLPSSEVRSRLVVETQAALDRVEELRGAIKRQLGVPLDERDGTVIAAWFPAVTDLIQTSQELFLVSTDGFGIDAHTHRLGTIKHFAWMAAEFSGRERAIVGASMSLGKELTPKQLNILSAYRGSVETAWKMISDTAVGEKIAPPLKQAVVDADGAYFSNFEMIRQSIYRTRKFGHPYPMTATAWFEHATGAIDTLVAVHVAAGKSRRAYLDELMTQAGLDLVAGIFVLVAALVAGISAFWVVSVRVMGPVSEMTGIMGRLAGGDLDADVPGLDRNDEIGAMARALDVFKENDIERRRVEEELRNTKDELEIRVESRTRALKEIGQRHEAILENAAEGIITANEKGIIETFNSTAENLFGYKADEVIGKKLNILMAGEDALLHEGYINNFLETGAGKILGVRERELLARRKDGTLFHFELNVAEFYLGGERRFIGTLRDISERKKAEEEIRRHNSSMELIRAIAQAANEARTVEVAMEACLEEVCIHTGWPVGHVYFVDMMDPDRLITTKLWHDSDPDSHKAFRELTEETNFAKGKGMPGRVLESGRPEGISVLENDKNFPRLPIAKTAGLKSGFAFPVPVRGQVGAVLEFFSDQFQEVDDRMLEIMDQIGTQVGQVIERNQALEQLARAMEEAEFADRAKTEFLANMSHELRTPLNSIIGFSEVLHEGVFGAIDNPRYVEYLGDINSSGKHLLELINDILDVSKVEAGAMELVEEIIILDDIIRESLRVVRNRAEEGGIDINFVTNDYLPRLNADPLRVKQILLNLLSNSVKFTPPGGEVTVTAGLNGDGGFAISVADTGIGIAEEEIKEILEPFTQAHSGRAKRNEGTGLGLYLVKKLIEEHEGSFNIKSRLGQGTIINIHFPKERVMPAVAEHPAEVN